MLKNVKIKYKLFLAFLFIAILPLTAITFFLYNQTKIKLIDEITKEEAHDIETRKEYIGLKLSEFSRDTIILSELTSLQKFIDANKNTPTSTIAELKKSVTQDFITFLQNHNDYYYKLRYIDETGYEIINIKIRDSANGKPTVVPEAELLYKGDSYYFRDLSKAKKGIVFVSPMDLNKENDILENIGTEEKPKYVPVIRYGTPLFDKENNRKGIILITINADVLLNKITTENQHNIISPKRSIFLINQDGYFLYNPKEELRWGFIFNKDNTIFKHCPSIAEDIFKTDSAQFFDDKYECFVTFTRIYPSGTEPSVIATGESRYSTPPETPQGNEYFWTLYSRIEKDSFYVPLKKIYYDFLTISLITLIFIIFFAIDFGRLITQPIKDLGLSAKIIKEGNYKHRSTLSGKDELGELANTLNELSSALQKNKIITEKKIKERTQELENLNKFMIGRELKMAKLKQESENNNKKKKK